MGFRSLVNFKASLLFNIDLLFVSHHGSYFTNRYNTVYKQCRPLLYHPHFQAVLMKLVGDKEDVEVAKVIKKTLQQHRLPFLSPSSQVPLHQTKDPVLIHGSQFGVSIVMNWVISPECVLSANAIDRMPIGCTVRCSSSHLISAGNYDYAGGPL